MLYIVPQKLQGVGSRTPADTKTPGRSRSLSEMAQYLHVTYAHPPIHFKSLLGYF